MTTVIAAPAQRCFDLARDVDAHVASTAQTRERALGARVHGLLEKDEEVTWAATHFGIPFRLTSRITAMDKPRSFVDEMVRGPFHSLRHTHDFLPEGTSTRMLDTFEFEAPFGPIGRLSEELLLTRNLRTFLERRAQALKRMAES